MGMSMTRTPSLPSNSRSRRPLASSHIPVTSTTLSSCRAASSEPGRPRRGGARPHSAVDDRHRRRRDRAGRRSSKSMSSITSPTRTSWSGTHEACSPEAHCRLPCRANGRAADALLHGGRRGGIDTDGVVTGPASGSGARPVSADVTTPTSWAALTANNTLRLAPLVDRAMSTSPGRPWARTRGEHRPRRSRRRSPSARTCPHATRSPTGARVPHGTDHQLGRQMLCLRGLPP